MASTGLQQVDLLYMALCQTEELEAKLNGFF